MNLNKLNAWLQANDFDCTCEKGDDDFEYDDNDEIIYCGELADNCEDRFTKYAKTLGLINKDINIETLAFLHELGHYHTLSCLSSWEECISLLAKWVIYKTPTTNDFIAGLKYAIYYRLPMEKIATQWAIAYANENPCEVANLTSFMKEK